LEIAEIGMWQTFLGRGDVEAAAKLRALERALERRSYLVGDRLTLADLVAYVVSADAVARAKEAPAAKRWLQQIQQETRRLAPEAKRLPALVDLKLPVNVPGPLPLPLLTKNDKKKDASSTSSKKTTTTVEKTTPAADAAAPKKKKTKKAPAPGPAGEEETAAQIFSLMEIKVGVIVDCWEHAEAEKLFCEKIDVGEAEPRTIASGLRAFYDLADLKDRKVLVFTNLKARTMSGFKSEGMVLCASSDDHSIVKFLEPPKDAKPGERVALEAIENQTPATPSQVQKKKLLEKLLPFLRTNASGLACCDAVPFTLPEGPVKAPLPTAAIG